MNVNKQRTTALQMPSALTRLTSLRADAKTDTEMSPLTSWLGPAESACKVREFLRFLKVLEYVIVKAGTGFFRIKPPAVLFGEFDLYELQRSCPTRLNAMWMIHWVAISRNQKSVYLWMEPTNANVLWIMEDCPTADALLSMSAPNRDWMIVERTHNVLIRLRVSDSILKITGLSPTDITYCFLSAVVFVALVPAICSRVLNSTVLLVWPQLYCQ